MKFLSKTNHHTKILNPLLCKLFDIFINKINFYNIIQTKNNKYETKEITGGEEVKVS